MRNERSGEPLTGAPPRPASEGAGRGVASLEWSRTLPRQDGPRQSPRPQEIPSPGGSTISHRAPSAQSVSSSGQRATFREAGTSTSPAPGFGRGLRADHHPSSHCEDHSRAALHALENQISDGTLTMFRTKKPPTKTQVDEPPPKTLRSLIANLRTPLRKTSFDLRKHCTPRVPGICP